jgi:hypothetical protein
MDGQSRKRERHVHHADASSTDLRKVLLIFHRNALDPALADPPFRRLPYSAGRCGVELPRVNLIVA